MSDDKHTLGPWHRNIRPITKYPMVFAGRNTHIAKVVCLGIGLSEAEANADLISAAPALLKAAQAALAYDAAIQRYAARGESWVESDDLDALYAVWMDASRAAVAQANGGAA